MRPGWLPAAFFLLWVSPAVAAEILTAAGLDPVTIGMTRTEAQKALGIKLKLQGEDPSTMGDCATANSPDERAWYMFQKFRVVRIDIEKKGITSPEGIGVGSSEAAIRKTYGRRAKFSAHPYGNGGGDADDWHYVRVRLRADRDLLFETDGKRVTSFRVGIPNAVSLIEGCS
jgi:hypothetical protein